MLYIEKPQIVSIYSCNEIMQIWEEKGKPQRFNVDACSIFRTKGSIYEFYSFNESIEYLNFGYGDYIVIKNGHAIEKIEDKEYIEDNYIQYERGQDHKNTVKN